MSELSWLRLPKPKPKPKSECLKFSENDAFAVKVVCGISGYNRKCSLSKDGRIKVI